MSGGSGGFIGAVGLIVFVVSASASLLLTPTVFEATWPDIAPHLRGYGAGFQSWAPYVWLGLVALGIYGTVRAVCFFVASIFGLLVATGIIRKRWK